MIGYMTFGTADLQRAAIFYDLLLAELGAKRIMELERGIAWGTAPDAPGFGVMWPFDGKPAVAGNGFMVSFRAPDRAAVDRVHARALELGGTCEGAPGPRGPGLYIAYFRDLDGNKLATFVVG